MVEWYAHLQCLALDTVRLVDEYIRTPTDSNLPRGLFKSYSFKGIGIVDVN
jgi:hypothetical protein